MVATFITIGIICLIAAIIGGGLKAANMEFPLINDDKKQILLGLLGIALIITGMLIKPNHKTAKFIVYLDNTPTEGIFVKINNTGKSQKSNRDGLINFELEGESESESLILSFTFPRFLGEFDTTILTNKLPPEIHLFRKDFKNSISAIHKSLNFNVYYDKQPIEGIIVNAPNVGLSVPSNRDGNVKLEFDFRPGLDSLRLLFLKSNPKMDFDTIIAIDHFPDFINLPIIATLPGNSNRKQRTYSYSINIPNKHLISLLNNKGYKKSTLNPDFKIELQTSAQIQPLKDIPGRSTYSEGFLQVKINDLVVPFQDYKLQGSFGLGNTDLYISKKIYRDIDSIITLHTTEIFKAIKQNLK